MSEHKTCRGLLDNLSAYLDGEAAKSICEEIDLHLAHCENCRVVVDTLRRTVYLYHALPQPDLPDVLRERLYKTLDLEQYLKKSEDK